MTLHSTPLSAWLALPLSLLLLEPLAAQGSPDSVVSPRDEHYREINGLNMYYQVYGVGRPLLLLHGGFATIEQSFSRQLAYFSRNHLVVAPEQQGHGRTRDIDGPLDYVTMADNTAELLVELHLAAVDVVGHSDGGIIALLLTARHPALVRRLVISGASTLPLAESFQPEIAAEVASWDPASDSAGLGRYRTSFADPPSHYPVIVAKLKDLWLHHPTSAELGPAVLATVAAPTLVIAGDHDGALLNHTIAIWRSLPNGQLFIVPGTSHFTFQERPEWLNPIVAAFLADSSLSR